ncbi:peptide/nickel transport system substrate-binding protein [Modestobacter sp. DSM 44400]|uniref:ABC transporter substrate-binding protein n=1 Tax=Modestobacter sp. DSM 44400 TaxID=1550230 RepID=UPI0008962FD2|nr:ABC transporter substrate-binding protein [Modestobacter sp. DSM 44400]SDY27632.1 peptide/nickel transport system substrate-binding protein [Modestobacter sp. DSM 44400]
MSDVITPAGADAGAFGQSVRAPVSRRTVLKAGGAGLIGLGLSSLLAACGGGPGSGTASGTKTLTVGVFQEPDSLDPAATGLAMVSMMISHIFDPLVWWLPNDSGENEFYPGLAESYEVSPDATTYTFKLRQDVDFHDGTHFDANAVKANLDHVVDPATKSRSAIGSLGPYQETVVVDQYTAQVVFNSPNAAFEREMTTVLFGMQSPAAIEKYGAADVAAHPTGTGPFTFVEYVNQDRVSLKRNDAYAWGPTAFGEAGPAKLETLTFKILLDTNARYNALRGGQIQMAMNLDPDTIQNVKSSGELTHYDVPSTGQPYGYPINVTKGPTDDVRVRQAILYAVDQDKLNEGTLRGAYTAAHNFLTPTTPGYAESVDSKYAYDPEKAKSLLEEAGWTAGPDGTRSKAGQPLTLDILIQTANGFDLPTQFVVNALKEVGFTSNTTSQPFTTAAASYNQGVQNLSAIFYYDVDPYLMKGLVSSDQIASGFNWAHYSNPAIDAAIAQANSIVDTDQRTAAYEAITTTLMEDAIFLPLWNVSGIYSGVKNLKDVMFGATGYSYYHVASFA